MLSQHDRKYPKTSFKTVPSRGGNGRNFFTRADTDEDDVYKTKTEKLDEFFAPKKNVDFEISQFHQANQNFGDTNFLPTLQTCHSL